MVATLLRGFAAILIAICLLPPIYAQNAQDTPQLNRAVLRYFDTERMQELLSNPERVAKVMYYFTHSFQVTLVDCNNCPIDYEVFYNTDLFNMYQYENQRLPSAPVTLNYRDKYVVTLAPADEVAANLGGITPFELIRGIPYRPLPTWVATGNDDYDFQQYKTALIAWKTDFPQDFKQLKKSKELVKIRYVQFRAMNADQRAAMLSQSPAYLIVDDEVMTY